MIDNTECSSLTTVRSDWRMRDKGAGKKDVRGWAVGKDDGGWGK